MCETDNKSSQSLYKHGPLKNFMLTMSNTSSVKHSKYL